MGVGGQRHVSAALPPGMIRYPLYRRLGRPQDRSGRVLKISPPPGFDPRTVQLVASRYNDYAIPAHPKRRNPDKCICVSPRLHTHKTSTDVSSSAPHYLHKALSLSLIMSRCLLRVLYPVRRPITTLDCVLLKDNPKGINRDTKSWSSRLGVVQVTGNYPT
jgi:hypothetical protein